LPQQPALTANAGLIVAGAVAHIDPAGGLKYPRSGDFELCG